MTQESVGADFHHSCIPGAGFDHHICLDARLLTWAWHCCWLLPQSSVGASFIKVLVYGLVVTTLLLLAVAVTTHGALDMVLSTFVGCSRLSHHH